LEPDALMSHRLPVFMSSAVFPVVFMRFSSEAPPQGIVKLRGEAHRILTAGPALCNFRVNTKAGTGYPVGRNGT